VNVFFDLELPELAAALTEFLPAGIKPSSIHLDPQGLRIDARGPFGVRAAVVAGVRTAPGELILTDVSVEGLPLGNAMATTKLHEAIADLDIVGGPFKVRGSDAGRRIVVNWSAPEPESGSAAALDG
jgi:hypothetical protein